MADDNSIASGNWSGETLVSREYIGSLIRNEIATYRLYKLLAGVLSRHADFWSTLAAEEMAHADVLGALQEQIASGQLVFSRPDDFHLPDIKQSIEWTEKLIVDFASRPVTMDEALRAAEKVERNMVEGRFFYVVEADEPAVASEFHALHKHSEEHYARITKLMSKRFI